MEFRAATDRERDITGVSVIADLPDGRIAFVSPLVGGRARLNIGDIDGIDQGY